MYGCHNENLKNATFGEKVKSSGVKPTRVSVTVSGATADRTIVPERCPCILIDKKLKLCKNEDLKNNLLTKDADFLQKEQTKFMVEKSIPRTSDLYKTFNIPERFECPYMFRGYGVQTPNKNPFYRTVNSEYGYYFPNLHTVPTKYFPREQKFTIQLAKAGLYRNCSLNTQSDTIQFSTKPTLNNITCRK